MEQTIAWLRGLAEKGGKGVVDNIDARCLGRIADQIEELRMAVRDYISERDNPVPDYGHRWLMLRRLRELADCPPEPKRENRR